MDLTAVATPGYFASMGLEHWLLKRRAEKLGPTAADYEKGDTLANLAMGTASLLVPLLSHRVAEKVAPQRSKAGKALIGLAAGAAVATTVADRIVRRRKARGEQAEVAEKVARIGGPTTIVAGGFALTTGALIATKP